MECFLLGVKRITFILFLVYMSSVSTAFQDTFKDEMFIVSNYPEKITSPGLLFDEILHHQSIRVLYHHHNVSDKPLYIVGLVSNLSSDPITLNKYRGMGGSSTDIVFSGHKAAKDFILQLRDGPDQIVVPPHSSQQVLLHLIKPNQTSSGILKIEKKDKIHEESITFKMAVVEDEFSQLSMFSDVTLGFDQYHVAVFDNGARSLDFRFDCKQTIGAVEIGGKPYQVTRGQQYELKGNYGVVYFMDIFLSNSLNTQRNVSLFLSPKKEDAVDRGVFLINGRFKELSVLYKKNEMVSMQKFFNVTLLPGQTKQLHVVTMPQAGCFYPVDLIIKSHEVTL